jgi:hypothetical protein
MAYSTETLRRSSAALLADARALRKKAQAAREQSALLREMGRSAKASAAQWRIIANATRKRVDTQ